MKKFFRAGWLLAALAHQTLAAESPAQEPWFWREHPMPDGITIRLESERTNYFLGENIVLYYRIGNTSSNTFKISVGGDYRGSTRADRFLVTAILADGKPVADPTPAMRNFGGGLMPQAEIKTGGDWFEKVPVLEYCRFDAPGIYTVRAFHDLGFGRRRDGDPREVSLTVRLDAPTDAQARAILVADETAKPYSGNTWGQKSEVRLDYPCIRHPAFLPALIERAASGNQNAQTGIAGIRTIEATRALVTLLAHTNQSFAAQAGKLLEARLPHSEKEFEGPWGAMRKQSYIANVWDENLGRTARDFSLRLLAGGHREDFLIATGLLERIGTAREVPALLLALEFAVTQTNAGYLADIQYPAPIRACDALLGTALTLDTNLDLAPREVRSPGQALLFIAKHGGGERTLTEEEQAVFANCLRHALACVRMKALENLPKEIPASLAELVTTRMTDPNLGVQNYAFLAAGRMPEPRHRDIALAVLKSSVKDSWLEGAAHGLALRHGARYECAQAWATRLVVPKDINDYAAHRAVQHLFELTVGQGPNGGFTPFLDTASAQALRERWEKFLTANQERIQTGTPFRLGDADLPADLLPAGFNF